MTPEGPQLVLLEQRQLSLGDPLSALLLSFYTSARLHTGPGPAQGSGGGQDPLGLCLRSRSLPCPLPPPPQVSQSLGTSLARNQRPICQGMSYDSAILLFLT